MQTSMLTSLGLLTSSVGRLIQHFSLKSMNKYSRILNDLHDPKQLKLIMDYHEKLFGIKPIVVRKGSKLVPLAKFGPCAIDSNSCKMISEKELKSLGVDPKLARTHGLIYIPSNTSSAVLGHELGHIYYGEGKGNWLSKLVHSTPFKIIGNKLSPSVSFITGLALPKSKVSDTLSIVTPAVLAAPELIREASASIHAMKTLDKIGASEGLKKSSRKQLLSAYGTYIGANLATIGDSMMAHDLGKWCRGN